MKESSFTQGAITTETPFTVMTDGIYYLRDFPYLKKDELVSLRESIAVCKALNAAYQKGFEVCANSLLNKEK